MFFLAGARSRGAPFYLLRCLSHLFVHWLLWSPLSKASLSTYHYDVTFVLLHGYPQPSECNQSTYMCTKNYDIQNRHHVKKILQKAHIQQSDQKQTALLRIVALLESSWVVKETIGGKSKVEQCKGRSR